MFYKTLWLGGVCCVDLVCACKPKCLCASGCAVFHTHFLFLVSFWTLLSVSCCCIFVLYILGLFRFSVYVAISNLLDYIYIFSLHETKPNNLRSVFYLCTNIRLSFKSYNG